MKSILFAACLGLALASSAQAVTCSSSNVTGATQCQLFSGNDDASALNGFGTAGLFGVDTWIRADKSDDGGLVAPFNLVVTSTGKSGTFAIDSLDSFAMATLVIKASNGFIAYLLNTSVLSGSWSTLGLLNNGGKQPDMSHVSLYVGGGKVTPPPPPPPPSAVPLPASALLLIGALGGLAALRRKA